MKTFAFAAIAMLASTAAAQTPLELVQSVYREDGAVIEPAKLPGYYAADLAAALAQDQKDEDGGVGFDWLYGAQDFEIADLAFAEEAAAPDRSQVQVRFKNFGEPKEVYWLLCRRANGDWRIDNVMTMDWGLREAVGLGPEGEC